jgi:MSHA biogenesis protein MshL
LKLKATLVVTAVAAACFLAGCASVGRPLMEPSASVLSELNVDAHNAMGNGTGDSTEIEAEFNDVFINRMVTKSDPLPFKKVAGLSFNDSSVIDALQILLSGTNISLSFHNTSGGNAVVYGSVATYNLSGTLSEVLENISQSAGFFYSYKNGILNVYPDEQFIVDLPPIVSDDVFAGLANTITKLGGFDVFLDRQNRTIVYRSNKAANRAIEAYLEHTRNARSMIVYDTYIYQVQLDDSVTTGINWKKLGATAGHLPILGGSAALTLASVGSGATITSGQAIGFNAVYDSKNLSMDALFTFLQSQGNVKTIAQPKLAIISGGKGSFKVGQETNYVSKVGSNSITTGLNQITVETAKIQSGLNIGISGEVHDGTIYTRIALTLTDLIKFNLFQALGTELNLPQTANRELSTVVRARPGNIVLLAGINNTSETTTVGGLPGTGGAIVVPSNSTKAVTRSELVIIMKPKLITFAKKKQEVVVSVAAIPSVAEPVKAMPVAVANAPTFQAPLSQPNEIIEYTNESYVPVVKKIKSIGGPRE